MYAAGSGYPPYPAPHTVGPALVGPEPSVKPPVLSTVSLVAAIVGFLVSFPAAALGVVFGVAAVCFGFVAVRREPRARGRSLAGIIVGFVAITFAALAYLVVLAIDAIGAAAVSR
ncbi:MAG TPA: hypothetical protein VFU07_02005 [Candidatus Lumbricidophila sp.]|nr:hypothetical protein [Candidatus Lumbricidophila sp.]